MPIVSAQKLRRCRYPMFRGAPALAHPAPVLSFFALRLRVRWNVRHVIPVYVKVAINCDGWRHRSCTVVGTLYHTCARPITFHPTEMCLDR